MLRTVLLVIFFVLCVLLLLPVRLKGSFGDGKWTVSAYYAFIRVFRRESKEKPKPEIPKKPDDLPEGEAPPIPEPEPPAEEKSAKPKKKPKVAAASAENPETVTEKPNAETETESEADMPDAKETAEEADAEKHTKHRRKKKDDAEQDAEHTADNAEKKPKKRGFIRRLKPQSLDEGLGLVKDACAALSPALKFLTRHLHFRHIKLYLAVGSDDPANTATLYGKICAAVYNLLAALQCWVDIEVEECRILADFYNESMTFRAAAELRVSPMAVILLVLILGIKFLWRTLCRFRREDQEAKRKAKETAPTAV